VRRQQFSANLFRVGWVFFILVSESEREGEMSVHKWQQTPMDVIQACESARQGRGETSALVLWATWAVEELHYLDELDLRHHGRDLAEGGHPPHVVTIAHARWAAGSAVTALDLCAAALARECCNWSGSRAFDFRDFDPDGDKRNVSSNRSQLPDDAIAWIDAVLNDQRYKDVQGARNPFTHSRLKRRLTGAGPQDTEFVIAATGNVLSARDLICCARDIATERVTAFLGVLAKVNGGVTVANTQCRKEVADKVVYEIRMLRHTFKMLKDRDLNLNGMRQGGVMPRVGTGITTEQERDGSAILESFLLHARVLRGFFAGNRDQSDDVLAEDFVPGWVKPQAPAYPYLVAERKRLNKALAHLSAERVNYDVSGKDWDVEKIRKELEPIIKRFLMEASAMPHSDWFDDAR